MTGKTISHYHIIEKLGEGGMGVVYKALDTKLNRPVALKFIVSGSLQSEEKKFHLLQEAQAAASVNHPNVCTVYEIDEIKKDTGEKQVFIALEFIEGFNLEDKIRSGPLNLLEAVDIVIQIAEGLKAIHDKGLVHRDIKSDNIRITGTDQVKIMDFGLVKSIKTRNKFSEELSTGGTIAYMSPEQIRGTNVDHRSDIWSLGIVFFEMITGNLPFSSKKTNQAVIYSILDEEPESIREIIPDIPSSCIHILDRALEKSTEYRYQSMKEMLNDLKHLKNKLTAKGLENRDKEETTGSIRQAAKKTNKRLWMYAALLILGIIIISILHILSQKKEIAEPTITVLTSEPGMETFPSLSPDGTKLLYCYEGDIYLKLIGENDYMRLTDHPMEEYCPVWSPDGNTIAYIRQWSDQPGIYKRPLIGGREIRIHSYRIDPKVFSVDIRPQIDWSWDGRWIVFNDYDTVLKKHCLYRLDMKSRKKEQLTFPETECHGDMDPRFSPDGKTIVYLQVYSNSTYDLFRLDLRSGQTRQLTFEKKLIKDLAWMPDGRNIIFSSNRDGISRIWLFPLKKEQPVTFSFGGQHTTHLSLSRDGKRLAYVTEFDLNYFIEAKIPATWPSRLEPVKLTSSSRSDMFGDYSPDGKKISFGSNRSGFWEIWACNKDGTNPIQLTYLNSHSNVPDWSPDGKWIVFENDGNILIIDSKGINPPKPLVKDPSDNRMPFWSHDGQSVYFSSDRTGEFQLHKIHIETGKIIQLTKNGGFYGDESTDGKYFYYFNSRYPNIIWQLDLITLKESPFITEENYVSWHVTAEGIFYFLRYPDGERVLKFYKYATGITEQVSMKHPHLSFNDISPDGRMLLLSKREFVSDIYLVENFQLRTKVINHISTPKH